MAYLSNSDRPDGSSPVTSSAGRGASSRGFEMIHGLQEEAIWSAAGLTR